MDANMTDSGYVNYFEILGLAEGAKPGEVRNVYRRRMKALVSEIARVEITEDRRNRFLLEMSLLNAALLLMRDTEAREHYWAERQALIELESEWCDVAGRQPDKAELLQHKYDAELRAFLSRYIDELMLEAGRDKECVEASNWDAFHERHAARLLRHYRQQLYQTILERLPHWQVTPPDIDWDERGRTAAELLRTGAA
jgi:hypothetical protein